MGDVRLLRSDCRWYQGPSQAADDRSADYAIQFGFLLGMVVYKTAMFCKFWRDGILMVVQLLLCRHCACTVPSFLLSRQHRQIEEQQSNERCKEVLPARSWTRP